MFIYENNKKMFKFGREDYEQSRIAARDCLNFREDDEDEQVDSTIISCYNCIYRRWSKDSFNCMRPK